jgi:ferredoxin-NADP reductase
MAGAKISVRVAEVVEVNKLVKRFKFARTDGGQLPAFSGGAHTIVEMDDEGVKRMNPYSLMSDPTDSDAYTISVRRDDAGRGGSLFMHNNVSVGMTMVISHPVNLFPLDFRAKKHLMIAGGIGITPFLGQIKQLSRNDEMFELHYAMQSAAVDSYVEELTSQHPHHVHVYYDDQEQSINLKHLLSIQALGTHLYICGPKGMIDWVNDTAKQMGWSNEVIHFEEFLAPPTGIPFEVNLKASDKLVTVQSHQSLLEAIEASGVDAPYLCRGGCCGQCETEVLEFDGEFEHHDHWLSEEDHKSGKKIMPCVSRFTGSKLVLDR